MVKSGPCVCGRPSGHRIRRGCRSLPTGNRSHAGTPPPFDDIGAGAWAEIRHVETDWRPWHVTRGSRRFMVVTVDIGIGLPHVKKFRTREKAERWARDYIAAEDAKVARREALDDGAIRLGSRA